MNIKKHMLGIFASVIVASSAGAESYTFNYDEDVYVSLFGRLISIQDQDVSAGADDFGVQAGGADYEVNYEDGWSVGALIGFPLVKSFRGEIEGSYSWWDASDWDGTATLTIDGVDYTLGGSAKVEQWGRSVSLYTNLIWDVRGDTGIGFLKPYVGWGFGADHTKEHLDNITIAGTKVGVDEDIKSTRFGTQVFFGADVLHTSNWTGGLRFGGKRIFNSHEDPASDAEILGIQANIRYNF